MRVAPLGSERISIRAKPRYLPDHSDPEEQRYVFSYTIVIRNDGTSPATLRRRHWIITDGLGRVEEVEGEGVVGEEPRLEPGESFEYTSGCVLETPRGTMHGTYTMERDGGDLFEAEIAPFLLTTPGAESSRVLN